ncbi:MAG: hypothetical protein PUB13_10555, partial [Lachnospiraceae bacterium]|nr:hypothetical protein [Lachnospiraceae bacterium]
MGKKQKNRKESVNVQLNAIFLKAMMRLGLIVLVLVALIVIITISNRRIFEKYGAGQGKAGSVEIQFSTLHEEIRYLVFETRGEEQQTYIAEIETQAAQLQEEMKGLKEVIQGKENQDLYAQALQLSEEYKAAMDEIIEYENQSGKYNSEKIYNTEATEIARQMKE